ncbi:MAG: RNase adapter RapZ [Clostridiales Family XIII bacterium]|jgi:UPF0042 nucleotide-binding protein|nr:RNase adapter RapZ [Clostridiales Family XIII bacterium]
MEIIIITGLSGAGKTHAKDYFEDSGYYCIDNMPPSLIRNFVELIVRDRLHIEKAAFVIDVRGGNFLTELKDNLTELKKDGIEYRILFLDASDKVILRRYSETRRDHPLSGGKTNTQAIREERAMLESIRKYADLIIDTSALNNVALMTAIRAFMEGDAGEQRFKVIIQSFGYKLGVPGDTDIVFDMRFIPNPFYVDSLKKLTGKSRKVQTYVMKSPEAVNFLEDVIRLYENLKPAYMREGKNSLSISFGCTGGQHRSVAMANMFYERLKAKGEDVVLSHRDL